MCLKECGFGGKQLSLKNFWLTFKGSWLTFRIPPSFSEKNKAMSIMQMKHQYSSLCLEITLLVPEIWKGHYHGCSICKVYPKLSFQTWLGHRRKNLDEYQSLLSLNRWREKAMAPHSSTLAWKIPWAEEPGRLQSMGSLRVGHNWVTSLSLFTFLHWRRKWQPTPVFLLGESQGRGSLVGCHLWGRTESNTTEVT